MAQNIVSFPAGSQLYGTSTRASDYDWVEIFLPEPDHLIGLKKAGRRSGDQSKYFIHDFIHLVLKGSIQHYEFLFVPDDMEDGSQHIRLWQELKSLRQSFWCRKLVKSVQGYINSEMNRIERHRRWAAGDVFPEEKKAHKKFKPNDYIQEYGWDLKGAYHCMRLVIEMNIHERTGEIPFPLPPGKIKDVMAVRKGEWSYDEWMEWMETARFDWDAPGEPEIHPIRELLVKIHKTVLEAEMAFV